MPREHNAHLPLVGLTCDLDDRLFSSRRLYAQAVLRCGGAPNLLPPPLTTDPAIVEAVARACASAVDAVVFTGGADPDMTPWGETTHPAAKVMNAMRQAFDTALLRVLDEPALRDTPVLGVCLGMQEMSLHAGGRLVQHLPDVMGDAAAAAHTGDHLHQVRPVIDHPVVRAPARVASSHHQAVRDAGSLRIVATSDDGVIEAVEDASRPFYLGVQWHPERTPSDGPSAPLADGLFKALVDNARARRASRAH